MKDRILLLLMSMYAGLLPGQASRVYHITSEFECINAEQERYNDLYTYTQLLEDPTGAWTYEDIIGKSDQFGPNTTRSDRDLSKIYWMKLQLQSTARDSQLFSVGLLHRENNLVDIYYEQSDSLYHQTGGFRRRPAQKTIRRSGSYFWVKLPADTIQTVYIRVDNQFEDCTHCWNKFKKRHLSIFHIDRSSVKYQEAAYVLQDLGAMEKPAPFESPRMANLSWYFEFYVDADCNSDLEYVRRDWDDRSYFKGYQFWEFRYEDCHWARLRVINPTSLRQTRTFAYPSDSWEHIEYYLPDTFGIYHKKEAFPSANGQKALTFSIPGKDTLELYIHYPLSATANSFANTGRLADVHPGDLQEQRQREPYKYFFAGGLAFFLIYFSLQLVVHRDYLQWYFFLLVVGLSPYFIMSLDHSVFLKFTQPIYLPSKLELIGVIGLAAPLAAFALLKFTQRLLALKTTLPLLYRISNYLIFGYLFLSSIYLCDMLWWWKIGLRDELRERLFCIACYADLLKNILNGVIVLFVLYTTIKAYRKKIPLSGSFFLALLPVALAIVVNSPLGQYLFPQLEQFAPFIVGLFLTLLLFGILIGVRNNRSQKEKLESVRQKAQLQNDLLQIESKALRAQMNPHFIFNCLNSIKSLIQDKANKEAVHYLTLFSKFIRQVLHHSEEKQISLSEELTMSRLYMEMEKLRFGKSFTFRIDVAPDLDTSFFKVPPMILQPFLENAIWHGLMHKEGEREVKLLVRPEGEGVKCIVEDNGIGRERAGALNVRERTQHRSFGTQLILDRLKVNKELFNSHFVVDIIDKMTDGRAAGTRVELRLGG